MIIRGRLTCPSLLHLPRYNRKNSKDLNHYLHDGVPHRLCCRHLGICLEPSEEAFNALEDIDERISARNNVLCRLCGFGIRTVRVMEIQDKSYKEEDTSTSKNHFRR